MAIGEVVRVRWWRAARSEPYPRHRLSDHPVVVAVDGPVTRQTAPSLVERVQRIAVNCDVVIDLTEIPEFDTDGAAALVGLQESLGGGRVQIIGLPEATERLIGADSVLTDEPIATEPWSIRRLQAIAVVQPSSGQPATTDDLDPVIRRAQDEDVSTVVIDLRGAELTRRGVDAIAFASSSAALRGQELLVVNLTADAAEQLRRSGLSATTYVAPEPLD